MTQEDVIDQLNHLIGINRNAEDGLRGGAKTVRNSELETLFANYATQHAKFAGELQQEVKRLGGTLSDSETFAGALHRGWMDVKAVLSGDAAASILKSCESGEESAEIAYTNVVDSNITGQTHTLIGKQQQQIRGFRTHLARLVGETKDGVEFQKNE
jgi:uncharacterized protein (TIGR02284 family)